MPKECRIPGCGNARLRTSTLCSMHNQRRTRNGSPTARRCRRCHEVEDSEASLKVGGSFFCGKCVVFWKPCRVEGCERQESDSTGFCQRGGHHKTDIRRGVKRCRCYKCRKHGLGSCGKDESRG